MLWSCGRARSRDKLEPLCLHYQSAHGHHTWQDVNLPWLASTKKSHDPLIMGSCKVTWQTKLMILWYHSVHAHQTWQNCDLLWVALTHKIIRLPGTSVDKWHVSLITKFWWITRQTKNIFTAAIPMVPNLGWWWPTVRRMHLYYYMILQSHGFVTSPDKFNTLYLHLH